MSKLRLHPNIASPAFEETIFDDSEQPWTDHASTLHLQKPNCRRYFFCGRLQCQSRKNNPSKV